MKLLVDIGNTTIKFGTSDSNKFNYLGRVQTSSFSKEDVFDVLKEVNIVDTVVYSSVVPIAYQKVKEIIDKIYNADSIEIKVDLAHKPRIEIDDPNELGVDLFCDLISGYELFGAPLAIIDLGTASKVLFINKEGIFNCCAIFIGYELARKSLSNKAALLPDFDEKTIKPISECHNTIDVLNSSNYYSQIDSVNGIIDRYEKEVGYKIKRVFTGGNATKFIKNDDICDEHLVLKGLDILSRKD